MRRPQGYLVIASPDSPLVERDTFTCVHCNAVTVVTPSTPAEEQGGWCFQCNKMVCKMCAGKDCVPFEKKLEEMERREVWHRSLG